MGCINSKKETSELHPNVFRVVHVDENYAELCSGQLVITETDLILYREGRESTVWPLHSLRRYGFEGDLFSFEAGRRCETGEGIFGFRCRRASTLFQALQHQIQLRNVIHDSTSFPVSRMTNTPSPHTRQTLQATVIHRSSIDEPVTENIASALNNNLANNGIAIANSPRSPSSADILEVMPLYPRPQSNSNHVTNIYQVEDFKREHNNNQPDGEVRHLYCNDLIRDLAVLRNNLKKETALNTMRDIQDETQFLESRCMNNDLRNKEPKNLSPTSSSCSERYAQLNIDQLEPRLYMNIAPCDGTVTDVEKPEINPLTPKQVEYCNLGIGFKSDINSYANLGIGDMLDVSKAAGKPILNLNSLEKFSESDTLTSMSPVEESEVNYAVLDIDSNKEKTSRDNVFLESPSYSSSKNDSITSGFVSTQPGLVMQISIEKTCQGNSITSTVPPANIGYTTIDFDKTVALTSVAADADINADGARKTRHNNPLSGSPGIIDKGKMVIQ